MPAVVLSGARQTGKSTLVNELIQNARNYISFDSFESREAAQRDPDLILGGNLPVTLDEVQREPRILLEVKRRIDVDRQPGRFLLTGSANLLLMNKVSETLAGRASYLTLWPMTRREQLGLGEIGIWTSLITTKVSDWIDVVGQSTGVEEDWRDLVTRGGLPTPALELKTAEARSIWFDGYVRTYLERDLQDLAAISSLPDFRRLMRIAANRIGGIQNQTDIGRDAALPQPTVHRYLNLLETSYMLVRLPSFESNRTKRLVKSPKLYWGDCGLGLFLSNSTPGGQHLENLVLLDLLAWRDSAITRSDIFFWRTQIGDEVDFVLETPSGLLPVEIKSTARTSLNDLRGLRTFMKEYEGECLGGLLIHCGQDVGWVGPNILSVPWWKII
jgi:predicted AAA+ superfamily ATPase